MNKTIEEYLDEMMKEHFDKEEEKHINEMAERDAELKDGEVSLREEEYRREGY